MTYTEVFYLPHSLVGIDQETERDIALAQAAAGREGCAPWCRFHLSYVEIADVCYSHPRGFHADEPYLVNERGEWGHRIWWPGSESVSPGEAEAFARQILALVDLARKDGAA